MPALDRAMVATKPERSKSPKSSQLEVAGEYAWPRPSGLKSAVINDSFARKPDRGGSPATSSAQVM
jgi:hypothetical protein